MERYLNFSTLNVSLLRFIRVPSFSLLLISLAKFVVEKVFPLPPHSLTQPYLAMYPTFNAFVSAKQAELVRRFAFGALVALWYHSVGYCCYYCWCPIF